MISLDQQSSLLELVYSQIPIISEAYKKRNSLIQEYKADGCDFVTDIDKQVEKNLSLGIREIFPTAVIFGEEFGLQDSLDEDSLLFLIDPIDGTKYFRYGMTFFTLSIGVQYRWKNIYGIILNPISGDIISGGPSYGVYNQFGKVESSKTLPLKETQIYYDTVGIHSASPLDQEAGLRYISELSRACYRARSAWVSCMYAFGAVSGLIGGIIDIFWGIKPTDQAGFSAILQGLGWEEREVMIGTMKNIWLAPTETLNTLESLLS